MHGDQDQSVKAVRSVIREGFLEKQSRFFKSWRKRWFVLTDTMLMTFKERKVYSDPTEELPLTAIKDIKRADQSAAGRSFAFIIETNESQFLIGATSNTERGMWMEQIGRAVETAKSLAK